MAKNFDVETCSLKGELSATAKEEYGMIIPDPLILPMYNALFRSFATMLKYNESKTAKKIGFSVRTDKGIFSIGSILVYNPPEDEDGDDEGNWVMTLTFNEADMEGCDVLLDDKSDIFKVIFQTTMFSEANVHCDDSSALLSTANMFIWAIRNFLDKNSNDSDEEVQLVMNSVFTAGVTIENGVKNFYIIPGYTVKQIIKNDDENEKEAA